MKFKTRARDERGAVLIIVAIVMTALLTLTAGGIMTFTLYGANREMQKAADQAAVAGAAALPLLRPGVALDGLPLNRVYTLADNLGLDVPTKGLTSVPDPRAVACAYAKRNLEASNARLITIYGSPANPGLGGLCSAAPYNDNGVKVELNSLTTPLSNCINSLQTRISNIQSQLLGELSLVGGLLQLLGLGSVTQTVNNILAPLNNLLRNVQNLEALAPALLTPEMTVTVRRGVNAPMMGFITGQAGIQMDVQATAERRLKNAVVLPNTPALTNTSLNTALAQTRQPLMDALSNLNTQVNRALGVAPGGLGLSACQDLLNPNSPIARDVFDIYNPPANGVAPSARDLITGATTAAQQAAAGSGQALRDIAGEAFLVIRQGPGPQPLSSVSNVLGDVLSLLSPSLQTLLGSLQIPAMDVAIVAAHDLEDGQLSGDCDPVSPTPDGDFICDAAAARGLFTAKLVK